MCRSLLLHVWTLLVKLLPTIIEWRVYIRRYEHFRRSLRVGDCYSSGACLATRLAATVYGQSSFVVRSNRWSAKDPNSSSTGLCQLLTSYRFDITAIYFVHMPAVQLIFDLSNENTCSHLSTHFHKLQEIETVKVYTVICLSYTCHAVGPDSRMSCLKGSFW
jgi:hypothetical protein